jgi:hypothetical protein
VEDYTQVLCTLLHSLSLMQRAKVLLASLRLPKYTYYSTFGLKKQYIRHSLTGAIMKSTHRHDRSGQGPMGVVLFGDLCEGRVRGYFAYTKNSNPERVLPILLTETSRKDGPTVFQRASRTLKVDAPAL